MARYRSELTNFLNDLKQQAPQIEAQQREGRALWWDRPADPEDQQRWQQSRVRQAAYVYYLNEPVKPLQGS